MEEYFDLVDEDDNIIGKATRKECHSNPKLIHRGADIFIFNTNGQILLQKRSMKKDLYPGMWSFSVTGHNDIGESYEDAAERETEEELGIKIKLEFFCTYKIRSDVESENCKLFTGVHDGPFHPNKDEIDEVKFFYIEEVKRMIAEKGNITPGFIFAFNQYLKSLKRKG